jgi:hypothetical protein
VLAARVLKILSPVSGSILIDIVCSPLCEYCHSANYVNRAYGALVGKELSRFGRRLSSILRTADSQDLDGEDPQTLPYRVPNIYRDVTARWRELNRRRKRFRAKLGGLKGKRGS